MSNSARPEIFTFIRCPIMGEPGKATQFSYADDCEVCGQGDPPEITFLDYQFDFWEGEDIVEAHRRYAVTPRLRNALEQSGLKGFSFRDMTTSHSQMFEEMDSDKSVKLPVFFEMLITGRASGPSGWWDLKGFCQACSRPIWDYTDRVVDALSAVHTGSIGPPREVSAKSWQLEDIFYIADPGPPIVTVNWVKLFTELKVKGVIFHPARWV
jgi:hypothetical protein